VKERDNDKSNIFSRFKALFQAHAVADQMEDPKANLDYSLTKLEENRRQITRSLIDVLIDGRGGRS
jgi:phage shock protein A